MSMQSDPNVDMQAKIMQTINSQSHLDLSTTAPSSSQATIE